MFSPLRHGLGAALLSTALLAVPGLAAENGHPLDLHVQNATSKVGEPTQLLATITVQEGYQAMPSYRNRIIELSALDDTVEFEKPVVVGSVEDGAMVFSIGVTPKTPGEHPINGVFRVGYHNDVHMRMVSIPLMATVTGTE
jgi:hypothetical protein